jgi:NADH dehydrogenase
VILLTGATGFVGRPLTRLLLEDGFKVRCLVRDPARGSELAEKGAELHIGDVTDKDSILSAIDSKIECTIHLVGILREARSVSFDALHVQATRNVTEALAESGVKRYIHMSALGSRAGAVSNYHRTKWAAEEAVRASGLDYTIIRPSVIFGRGDMFTKFFAGVIRRMPLLMLPGRGKGLMQPVFVEDVAKAYLYCLRNDETIGEAYELGGDERFSFDAVIDAIALVLKRKVIKLHIPMAVMRPVAAVAKVLLPNPPITKGELQMLSEDNVTDDTRLFQMAGISPTGFIEGMKGYLN